MAETKDRHHETSSARYKQVNYASSAKTMTTFGLLGVEFLKSNMTSVT